MRLAGSEEKTEAKKERGTRKIVLRKRPSLKLFAKTLKKNIWNLDKITSENVSDILQEMFML